MKNNKNQGPRANEIKAEKLKIAMIFSIFLSRSLTLKTCSDKRKYRIQGRQNMIQGIRMQYKLILGRVRAFAV